jgi:hypothetical protein
MARVPKKSKWRTVRCVVDYRTQDLNFSERDLARRVQEALDTSLRGYEHLDSKMWAKGFNSSVARMEGARPKKMQAAIRQLDAVLARLRKM